MRFFSISFRPFEDFSPQLFIFSRHFASPPDQHKHWHLRVELQIEAELVVEGLDEQWGSMEVFPGLWRKKKPNKALEFFVFQELSDRNKWNSFLVSFSLSQVFFNHVEKKLSFSGFFFLLFFAHGCKIPASCLLGWEKRKLRNTFEKVENKREAW